jgi:hypothetical protein
LLTAVFSFFLNNNIYFMKKLLAIAIVASAFTFTSCGDKSLSGRAASATCNCPALKEMSALSKEKDANPEKAMEATAKLMELMPKIQECTKGIEEEVKKLSADDMKKFQAEMQEKVQKSCPDLMPKKK